MGRRIEQKHRRNWGPVLRLALCIGLLAFVFQGIFFQEARRITRQRGIRWEQLPPSTRWKIAWTVGPQAVWRTILQLHPTEGVLSVACVGIAIFLGARRWQKLLSAQGLNLPWSRVVEISLVAQFFNSFLLGTAGGDLIKAYYTARETHHLKTESVTTVIVDRLLGLTTMLVIATIMIVPNLAVLTAHKRWPFLLAILLGMVSGALLVLYLSFFGGVSQLFPALRPWLSQNSLGQTLLRSIDAARIYGKSYPTLLQAVLFSVGVTLACTAQIALLAQGLDAPVSFVALLWIVPTVICISALPITPSGLGVRENLYVWLLSAPPLAMPATKALSLSLLALAGSIFWSGIGGLVYVGFRRQHRLKELVQEAEEVENPSKEEIETA